MCIIPDRLPRNHRRASADLAFPRPCVRCYRRASLGFCNWAFHYDAAPSSDSFPQMKIASSSAVFTSKCANAQHGLHIAFVVIRLRMPSRTGRSPLPASFGLPVHTVRRLLHRFDLSSRNARVPTHVAVLDPSSATDEPTGPRNGSRNVSQPSGEDGIRTKSNAPGRPRQPTSRLKQIHDGSSQKQISDALPILVGKGREPHRFHHGQGAQISSVELPRVSRNEFSGRFLRPSPKTPR